MDQHPQGTCIIYILQAESVQEVVALLNVNWGVKETQQLVKGRGKWIEKIIPFSGEMTMKRLSDMGSFTYETGAIYGNNGVPYDFKKKGFQ